MAWPKKEKNYCALVYLLTVSYDNNSKLIYHLCDVEQLRQRHPGHKKLRDQSEGITEIYGGLPLDQILCWAHS